MATPAKTAPKGRDMNRRRSVAGAAKLAEQADSRTAAVAVCELKIKAVPNGKKNEVIGRIGDAWKIRLQAPPVDGKANKALTDFLSEKLNLRRDAIQLLSGQTSREKRLQITGLSQEETEARLTV
jgi:uncharacterized protein (TIGR00251 family)